MHGRALLALVLLAALSVAGCGTLQNQEDEYSDTGHRSNRVYGGVRIDLEDIFTNFPKAKDDPSTAELWGHRVYFALWMLGDIPLSFIADTFLLHYDIWMRATGRVTVVTLGDGK